MIVSRIEGGMGNQMFQYGLARILALKRNATVLLDTSFFNQTEKRLGHTPRKFELAIFNNHYIKASDSDILSFQHLSKINKVKKKLGLNYPKLYQESSFHFNEKVWDISLPVYLKGFFQSYLYFVGHEDFIRQLFSFPIDSLDQVNKELLTTFKKSNTIAIHIRRGDYVNDTHTAAYHGSCDIDYYIKSIKLLTSKSKDFTLVFFSDESDWVEEQFKDLVYSKIFVDHNIDENSWKDMLLMSSCSHNIIANSSFSWWAAWLNENPEKKVIAPKEWFKTKDLNTQTLLPEEWMKL